MRASVIEAALTYWINLPPLGMWNIFRRPGHETFYRKIKMNFCLFFLIKAHEKTWAPIWSVLPSKAEVLCWILTASHGLPDWETLASGTQVLILYFMPRTMQVTSRLENTNTNKRVFKTDSDICQISRFWVYYWLVFVLCSLRFCVKRTIFWFYEGKFLFSQFYRWWSWGLENIKGLLYIGS